MEVRNLIKPNATVVQITEVNVGDVYKRLVESTYQEPKIVCGTVTEILNNGEEATLVALEFAPEGYGQKIEATTKVFNGKSEIALFPVTVEEFREYLAKAIEQQQRAVDAAERDMLAKRNVLSAMIVQSHEALRPANTKELEA